MLFRSEPNTVYEVRTPEKNGVKAVVLGTGERKAVRTNKAQRVAFEKQGRKNPLALRQFRAAPADLAVGAEVTLTRFKAGQLVDVLGVSKGKGFAGTIKRHSFQRGPETHGADHHREPGSIGAGTTPGRVYRGTRMAGQIGRAHV